MALANELMRLQGENSRVRRDLDELRKETDRMRLELDELRQEAELHDVALQSMQTELVRERRATRASKALRVDAERRLDEDRRLFDMEATKLRDSLRKEDDRVASLQRMIVKLRRDRRDASGHRVVCCVGD